MKRLVVILFMLSFLKAQNFGDVMLQDTMGLYTPGSGNGVAWDSHDGAVIIAGYKRPHGSFVEKGWVIKYDPASGDTVWSRFYKVYNKMDVFNDVVYDPAGYYVAAGVSLTSSSGDFWILRLTPDSGNVDWQGIYGDPSEYDEAKALTVDGNGNYVVVGFRKVSNVDYAEVMKINSQGDTVWTMVYNTPDTSRLYDVFCDQNGNYIGVGEIYEQGYGWKMWLVIISSLDGSVLGEYSYGTNGSNHRGRCGLLSSDNDFVVAGYTDLNGNRDYEVLKISSSDGTVVWDSIYSISYDQEAIGITRVEDTIYVTGYSSEKGTKDGFMMKIFAADGQSLDVALDGVYGVDDWENAVIVFQDNLFSVGSSSNEHLLTYIRPVNNLRVSDLTDFSELIGYDDKAYSIAIDSSGNYIIVGNTRSPDNEDNWQILAVKYNPVQDSILWWKIYGQRWVDNGASKVIVDSNGYYVVAGHTTNYDGNKDYWILKLDPLTGDTVWTRVYGGASDDVARSIINYTSGRYAVAGYTYSYGSGGQDGWLLVLDAGTGDTIYSKTYGGSADDAFNAVSYSDGYFVIVGVSDELHTWGDGWVLKVDSRNGDTVWTVYYGDDQGQIAYDAVVDRNQNYVVAGKTYSPITSDDVWILKLDSNSGDTIWTKSYGGSNAERAFSIREDKEGFYVVAGFTRSYGAGSSDYWALKLDPATGDTLEERTFGGSGYDMAECLSVDDSNRYVITGLSNSTYSGSYDFYTIKVYQGDNLPPVFDSITQLPNDTTLPFGPYQVDVKITDNLSGVDKGRLYWKSSEDAGFSYSSLTYNGNNWWGASISEVNIAGDSALVFYYVDAYDSAGNYGVSDTLSFWVIKPDTEPPLIDSLTQVEKDTTIPHGPYEVKVKAWDEYRGVNNVRLYWRSGVSGTFTESYMDSTGSNWWIDTIPEQVLNNDSTDIYYYVLAEDNAGNTSYSDTLSFWVIDPDTTVPQIDSLTQVEKDTTIPHGPYEVRVKVWDDYRGMGQVKFYWKSGVSGTFTESYMDSTGSNWWIDTIPEQVLNNDSTEIYYYVLAEDNAGNTSYSDTLSFWVIDPDTTMPILDSLVQLPKDTTIPHGPYEVKVKAWDDYRGVNNVRLYWRDDASGSFTESYMDSVGSNWWVDTIPEQVLNNDSTKIYYYVIAEDVGGNITCSDTLSFWVVDPDTLPPEIDSLIVINNDTVLPFGPYEVRVKSWDDYGNILYVRLYWKNDTMSDYTVSNMGTSGGDWWTDTIPQQDFVPDSMMIHYYVVSEDSAGNLSYSDTLGFWMVKPDTEPPLIDSLTQVEKDTTIPHGPYEVKVKAWDEYRGVNNVRLYWKSGVSGTFTESYMDSTGSNWWIDTIPEQVLNNDSTDIYYYVLAEDNAGNTSYSDTLSFWVIDPDTTVPQIDSLTQITRDNTPPYGPYDVWVKAQDEYRGIAGVELYWKKESQPAFIQSSMSGTSGDWWYGSIPEQTLDTDSVRIMYYVKATDVVGNISYSDTLSFYMVKPDTMAPQIDSLTQVSNDSLAPYGPYEIRVKVIDLYKKAGGLFSKGALNDINNKETSQVKLYWKMEQEAVFSESSMAYLGNDWWIDSIPEESFSADSIRVLYYVSAMDDAGNTSYSDTLSFWLIKLDTVAPVIDTVTQIERDSVPPYGPYEVWVNAHDSGGIEYARLYWKKASQPAFVQIEMNPAAGDWWVDSIPQQTLTQDSMQILYYAEVVDSSGNTGVSDTFGFWIVSPDTIPPQIDSLSRIENDTIPPYGPYEIRVKVSDSRKGHIATGIYGYNKPVASFKDAFIEKVNEKDVFSVKLYWKNDGDAVFHESDMNLQSGDWWTDTIPEQTPNTHIMNVMYYVKATDQAGNVAYSDTLIFTIITPDTESPVIDSLTRIGNDTTLPHGPYNVDVKVTDDYSGVASVTLYWKTSLMSDFSHDAMAGVSNNWWHDTIPRVELADVDSIEIFYFVTAEDSSSNMSVSDTLHFWVINPDTTPPQIDSLTQVENDSTLPYGPYEIRVWVNDSYRGVDSVKLLYRRQSQPAFFESVMEPLGENWWVDTIPEQSLDAQDSVVTMEYYIYAVDSAGNRAVSDTLSFELINPEYLAKEGKSIKEFGIRIPSMCKRRLSFVFMAPSSERYSVKVYSVNGRLVFNSEGKLRRGLTLVNIPVRKGGMYFVKIDFHGRTYLKKVVVVR